MDLIEDIISDLKHDTPEVSVLEVIECLEHCQDEISDLKTDLHYCNGVSDLAMKHRDIAEAEIDHLHDEADEYRAEVERYRGALKDIYSVTNDLQVMSIVMANLPAPTTVPPAEPTTESNDE